MVCPLNIDGLKVKYQANVKCALHRCGRAVYVNGGRAEGENSRALGTIAVSGESTTAS
jgi:hypothetical protein